MSQRVGDLDVELLHPLTHVLDLAAQFVDRAAVLVDERHEIGAALAALQHRVRRAHPPQRHSERERHAECEYTQRRGNDGENADSVRIELHR
jgi:hypothetical protein